MKYSEISKRVKLIRKLSGITQKEFSDKLGITQGYLSAIESGKKEPSEMLIILLCNLFGAQRKWLLTGEGEMTEKPGMTTQSTPSTPSPKINAHISTGDIGNNNQIHIIMDKKTRNGDKSLDAVAMLTKILASGNEKIINATLSHLHTMAELTDQK